MITQFTVGTSRTINLGNYESLRIEASVVMAVEEGTDPDDFRVLKEQAQFELRRLMEETYRTQKGKQQ